MTYGIDKGWYVIKERNQANLPQPTLRGIFQNRNKQKNIYCQNLNFNLKQ